MEPRLIVAYCLMLLITLLIGGLIAHRAYHSHRRTYLRRLRNEARLDAARPVKRG